jgi:hypothetical protein
MKLATDSRFADPDAAYRLIAQAVRPLDREMTERFFAALSLTLANQIADAQVLADAIALARRAAEPTIPQPDRENAPTETS